MICIFGFTMKYNKKHVILTLLLPVFYSIVWFLSQKPEFIERYYSSFFYPKIALALRYLLGWLPFSVGDVLGIFFIGLFVRELFFIFKNKFAGFVSKTLRITSFLSIIYVVFYLFWGLNYFRKPLEEKLKLPKSNYSTKQLTQVCQVITKKLNSHHFEITKNDTAVVKIPYSKKEIYQKSVNGYTVLSNHFPDFKYIKLSVKHSLVSLLQSYNGISGYINPITGEAQVNRLIPKNGYPVTTCHEMAHQIGWAAEDEANFIGFLTSTLNSDVYFKYSGYRMAFKYCYSEIRKQDKNLAKKIWDKLNKGIKKDYNNSYKHWKQYENPIEPYMKKGYNSYLKANKQKGGIESYNYVVDLLISYFEKKQLKE